MTNKRKAATKLTEEERELIRQFNKLQDFFEVFFMVAIIAAIVFFAIAFLQSQ